jgi:hypothetical protein
LSGFCIIATPILFALPSIPRLLIFPRGDYICCRAYFHDDRLENRRAPKRRLVLVGCSKSLVGRQEGRYEQESGEQEVKRRSARLLAERRWVISEGRFKQLFPWFLPFISLVRENNRIFILFSFFALIVVFHTTASIAGNLIPGGIEAIKHRRLFGGRNRLR